MHFRFALDLLDTGISSKHFVCLQDVFKKRSSRHVFKRYSRHVFKTPSRHVFKTSSRLLGRRKIVTLKTCWRRLQDMPWRRLQDILKTNKCLLGLFQETSPTLKNICLHSDTEVANSLDSRFVRGVRIIVCLWEFICLDQRLLIKFDVTVWFASSKN